MAVITIAAMASGCMGQPIGRLEKPNSSVAGGFGVEVGHPFSFGGIQILNASNETLTLDSVTPIDPSPGFQILGELARPADEEHTHLGGAGEYPPTGRAVRHLMPGLQPLRGFQVNPKSASLNGAQLVIGIKTTRPSPVTVHGFTVHYHDRFGNHYSYTVPYAMVICRRDPAPCPDPQPPDDLM